MDIIYHAIPWSVFNSKNVVDHIIPWLFSSRTMVDHVIPWLVLTQTMVDLVSPWFVSTKNMVDHVSSWFSILNHGFTFECSIMVDHESIMPFSKLF